MTHYLLFVHISDRILSCLTEFYGHTLSSVGISMFFLCYGMVSHTIFVLLCLSSASYFSKPVKPNTVYQEYIADKHHVHMNATRWTTLSQYTQWLVDRELVTQEERPDGLFIQYIDRDPAHLRRQEAKDAMLRAEAAQEQARIDELEKVVASAQPNAPSSSTPSALAIDPSSSSILAPSVKISLFGSSSASSVQVNSHSIQPRSQPLIRDNAQISDELELQGPLSSSRKRPISALTEIMVENQSKRPAPNSAHSSSTSHSLPPGPASSSDTIPSQPAPESDDDSPWLFEGLVVKIKNSVLGEGKYLGKKAVVLRVEQEFGAVVSVLDQSAQPIPNSPELLLDQQDLETVLPGLSKEVRIVKGFHKGEFGTLSGIDSTLQQLSVELSSGQLVDGLPYDSVCKFISS